MEDDRGELQREVGRRQFTFPDSLSAGSHHPEWFGGVIKAFVDEIEDPARRGENLAEAESCLLLTELAYESAAQGGRVLAVPAALPGAAFGAAAVA